MTNEQKSRFTVINNENYENERENTVDKITPPNPEFHTNPMYEKLLNYKSLQKKKRFTVEDLLKW